MVATVDELKSLLGCERYEVIAAQTAIGSGHYALKSAVKRVFENASIKSVASNQGGSRILLRIKTPSLGPNRVTECVLPAYRHTSGIRTGAVLKSICEAMSYQLYMLEQKQNASSVCSVKDFNRSSRWSNGYYAKRSAGNVWNLILSELRTATIAAGFEPVSGIVAQETTAVAVALDEIGLLDLIRKMTVECNSTTVHLDAFKKKQIVKCLERTRAEIRMILDLGISHESIKDMLDEELVRMVQEV